MTRSVLQQLRSRFAASPPVWVWLLFSLVVVLAFTPFTPARDLLHFFGVLILLHALPGVVLVRRLLGPEASLGERVGWGALMGVCMVGFLVTLASVLDFRLGSTFWFSYCALAIGILVIELWRWRESVLVALKSSWRPDSVQATLLLGVAAALFAKLGSVATHLTSPLHDPASHALMAKLIVESGHIPWFQLPFRTTPFFYPPGFASLAAASHWVGGASLAQLVLFWTNFSSVLTAVMAYFVVARAARSRGAGLWAFGFLAFLSIMPTEEFFLAGKNASVVSNFLFLGAALAMLRAVRVPTLGSACLLGALVATTFVVHYEKIFFLLVFFLAYALMLPFKAREIDWRRFISTGIAAGIFSLLFVAPWLYRIKWAMDQAKAHALTLVPGDPSPHLGAPLTLDSIRIAFMNYWEATSHFTDPSIAWLSLLAPLSLFFTGTLSAGVLVAFAVLMPLLHPAVVEPFGISMATLSYDRIAIHFAYLPVCLAAALGSWALWKLFSQVFPQVAMRWGRPALLVLTALLLVYGGHSQFELYRRVTASPVIDSHDMEAYAWVNANLGDRRPFVFPVQNPDHKNRRYFVGEAALYMPLFTDHDVVCHFLRIETPQIEAEFRNYEAMLSTTKPGLWVSRHWLYTRADRDYYAEINRWLETVEPGRLRERYRNDKVRILEVLPPESLTMASSP